MMHTYSSCAAAYYLIVSLGNGKGKFGERGHITFCYGKKVKRGISLFIILIMLILLIYFPSIPILGGGQSLYSN